MLRRKSSLPFLRSDGSQQSRTYDAERLESPARGDSSDCSPIVFGSVVRADARATSDVDLLVELEPGRSVMDLGGLLMDLQDHLHCKVDVMTPVMLKPRIRERVLREATPL
jgi:predicted nucleotidyltransferase